MYPVVQTCNSCGAGLTLEDLRATHCRYCKTVFPHHAQAAQHALVAGQVMNQLMAQQAQIQAQWRADFGAPQAQNPFAPMVHAGPPAAPGVVPAGLSGYAYADPHAMAEAIAARAQRQKKVVLYVALLGALAALLVVLAVVALLVG